ncbi:MAG: ABC transporter permease [Candidatus Woesearchaeota archaeon]
MTPTHSTERTKRGIENLLVLVQKNLKLLLRARASALVVILGPLLIIFLAGLAFDNTNLYAVRIGTYSQSYNDLSNSFIDKLAEKQFKITRYPTEETCTQGIRRGEIHTCIMFAPDFSIGKNGSNEIRFAVDYSQINLVWTILNVMTTSISARATELSRNLTSVLVQAVDFTRKAVKDRKQNLVALTTQNDEIGQRVGNIQAELLEIELSLDPGEFGISNLTSAKTIVKHWVDNSLNLGRSSLAEAKHFINVVDDLVKKSSAGSQVSNSLAASLQASLDDIGQIEERLQTTSEVVDQEYSRLSSLIDHLAGRITQTKSQIDLAENAKGFTLDELNTITKLLDQALLNILTIQKSLNEIEKVIGAIPVTDPQAIVQPVQTTIVPVVAERSYLNYLFPTLIALVMLFSALLLAPTLILFERNSPAYFRNFMTPTGDVVFISSIFVTTAFLLVVQLVIILAIAGIFFTQIFSAFAYAALVLALMIVLYTCLGMIIGYMFNSEETAMLAAMALGSIFLFISDIIIPIESMPAVVMQIAEYNPLVIGINLLRRTIVFNASFAEIWAGLVLLALFAAVSILLVLVVYYGMKNKLFLKYLAKSAPKKEQPQ